MINVPFWIMAGLGIFLIGVDCQRHGKIKEGSYNVVITVIAVVWQLVMILWAAGWKVW